MSNLHKHFRVHTGKKTVLLLTVFEVFFEAKSLRIHSKVHIKKVRYSCFLCTKEFALSAALQEHLRVHL
jgi:KRAB domain-containing zinc finger protein